MGCWSLTRFRVALWLFLKSPHGVGTGEIRQPQDGALAGFYCRQDTGGRQPEVQVASHTTWTFYFQMFEIYIYFSCEFRDNLPLQVSFSEQSPEIKSVLSCILRKRGNWILAFGGRRGEGRRREVQKEGKRHRFPESSSCFPLPHPCLFSLSTLVLSKTKPGSGLDTPSSFPTSLQRCPQLSELGPGRESHTEKDKHCMVSLIGRIWRKTNKTKPELIETWERLFLPQEKKYAAM